MEKTDVEILDENMGAFKLVLNGEKSEKGALWLAWHYLQVYATWGLRIPSTPTSLKLKLGITDPGAYSFFNAMLEAYVDVNETCAYFMETVFPGMVDIGNNLRSFAKDASPDGTAIFELVKEAVDGGDAKSAIEVIQYLQSKARENAAHAEEIRKELAEFARLLTEAQGKLKIVKDSLDADEKTSQATINRLSGGKDVVGSLLSLQDLLETQEDDYDHNVVVAATTVTYAWVPFAGWISAATVATVYGIRAVEALEKVEATEASIKAKTLELNLAVTAQNVQGLANNGVTKAFTNTTMAIEQTKNVRNAWENINEGLGNIAEKLEKSTTVNADGEEVLALNILIKAFANAAAKSWNDLLPDLNQLLDDPYITVESEEKSASEILEDVASNIPVAA